MLMRDVEFWRDPIKERLQKKMLGHLGPLRPRRAEVRTANHCTGPRWLCKSSVEPPRGPKLRVMPPEVTTLGAEEPGSATQGGESATAWKPMGSAGREGGGWDGHRGSLVLEFPAKVEGVQSCWREGRWWTWWRHLGCWLRGSAGDLCKCVGA